MKKAFGDLQWWKTFVLYRVNGGFQTNIWPKRHGMAILEEDWDTLIVCDACRYDLFCETNATRWFDTFSKATSLGSSTKEWLHQNFGDNHGDIVYIAGNPMVSIHKPQAFHRLIEVWKDGWDSNANIISAKAVREEAISALEEYSNKRLVIHFMQPHTPFFGYPELHFTNYDEFNGINPKSRTGAKNVWDAVRLGLVDTVQVWEAYRNNLEYVLSEVKHLLNERSFGKIVLTSDHGNVFPRRSYPIPIKYSGHPTGHRTSGLVHVPFGIVEARGKRPDIKMDNAESSSEADEFELEKNLAALGYR